MERTEIIQHRKLINKKIYHPIFGQIGEVKDLINYLGTEYIVFKERRIDHDANENYALRAIPAKLFYVHRSGELRVNFGSQWITEAPVFTSSDLDQNNEYVAAMVTEYYKNNTLWSGRILEG